MIPSGTIARFLPLKRLKTRIVWVAARCTPEDTKARLHAQPACCHGNIIAHHHGLFSLRFVRSVKLIDFGNLLDHESPLLSIPLRASLLEQSLACMSPRLLLKGAQAFTVYFLSWPTRGESFRGSTAGSEVAEGQKKNSWEQLQMNRKALLRCKQRQTLWRGGEIRANGSPSVGGDGMPLGNFVAAASHINLPC